MKKWFVFLYTFLTVVLVTCTVIYTFKLDKAIIKEEENNKEKEKITEIDKYIKQSTLKETLKLKISSTGEIKELKISDYLKGVLPAEMPPEYGLEALKAQAVVARTYLYQKMETGAHKDADICDSASHCQAWYSLDNLFNIWKRSKGYSDEECNSYFKKVTEAVESTENIVVTYNGKYIRAYFHACSGGKTEDVSAIWGKQEIPYLKSVESLGEETYKNYTSTVKMSVSDLQKKLNNSSTTKCNIDINDGELVEIISYTNTGRVDKVKIGGVIYTAEKLRTALGLRSTNFTVEYGNKEVIFKVKGNGHGVGMSQVGANYYSNKGYTYGEIIAHYYSGVDITYLYTEETNENKI